MSSFLFENQALAPAKTKGHFFVTVRVVEDDNGSGFISNCSEPQGRIIGYADEPITV